MRKWKFKEKKNPSKELIEYLGSESFASLLAQKGIDTVKDADLFLNPEKTEVISSDIFSDMQKAVERITNAIKNNEKIMIYGDFDADGITATSLLYKTLIHLKANVEYYIPNRKEESHGLNKAVILKLISKKQVKLFITVDCGISNVEEVALINTFKSNIIITDHHEAPNKLPDAFAIINPKAPNALSENATVSEITAMASLAGVGVAFKLACALLEVNNQIDFVGNLLPLVAVGTIADIVPLIKENRLLVTLGLKALQEGKNVGLANLLISAGCNVKDLTSDKIAFLVAPRINAAGRLDTANDAIKLLISENEKEIDFCVQSLNNFNKLRQDLCDSTYLEALEIIEKSNYKDTPSIFAYNPNWHVGIIGVVASKIVEKYHKPVFMFTKSETDDTLRCSIRSIQGVHVFNVLDMNAQYIESFGGHSMAAGLVLNPQKISLENFKTHIDETISEMIENEDLSPILEIDLDLKIKDLTIDFLNNISKLEPFGVGNESPVFAISDLVLESEKVIGNNKNHLKFKCIDNMKNSANCVFWNNKTLRIPIGAKLDIAFSPKLNEYMGNVDVQLDIKEVKSDARLENKENSEIKIFDHRKKINIFEQLEDYIKENRTSFRIFAENADIINKLSKYKILHESIINRKNLVPINQLVFFDYPTSEKLMKYIIKITQPKCVHFMNYQISECDIDEVILKVSGMLKYADSKYNGEIHISDIASKLSQSDDLILLIMKLLQRTCCIEVIHYKDDFIKFKFNKPVPFSDIIKNEFYEKARMELFKVKNYREKMINSELLVNI